MIVGKKIDIVEIPHEKGNHIHFRLLSGLEMDDARDKKSIKTLRRFGELGSETLDIIRSGEAAAQANATQVDHDPVEDYDPEFLITHAIVGWDGPEYNDIECTSENRVQLDEPTLEWAVKYIVEKNTVPLGKQLI